MSREASRQGCKGWKEGLSKQKELHPQSPGGMKHLGICTETASNWRQQGYRLQVKGTECPEVLLGPHFRSLKSQDPLRLEGNKILVQLEGCFCYFGLFQLNHPIMHWFGPTVKPSRRHICRKNKPTTTTNTFDSSHSWRKQNKTKHVSLIKRSTWTILVFLKLSSATQGRLQLSFPSLVSGAPRMCRKVMKYEVSGRWCLLPPRLAPPSLNPP